MTVATAEAVTEVAAVAAVGIESTLLIKAGRVVCGHVRGPAR